MNKKIIMIGPPLITKNTADMLKDKNFQIQTLSHDHWKKMKFYEKKDIIRQMNIVHFMWGQRKINVFLWARLSGVKTINHYRGTDVLWLLKDKKYNKFKAFVSNVLADRTLCVSSNLKDELDLLKIHSAILPGNIKVCPNVIPELRQNLGVYTYIPKERSDFYGWSLVEKLIQDFPDITFYILAHDGNSLNKYQNVEYLGWQDNMERWIKKSYIHLRLTEHDGLPKTVLEALAYGRQVIYSQRFPFCRYAATYPEIKEQFSNLIEKQKLNVEGARYIKEHFHPEKIKQKYIDLYNSL